MVFFLLAVNDVKAFFETINFIKHQWRVAQGLATWARKPKVPGLSPATSYVQS